MGVDFVEVDFVRIDLVGGHCLIVLVSSGAPGHCPFLRKPCCSASLTLVTFVWDNQSFMTP